MQTFDSPRPISVIIDVHVRGDITLVASDRANTAVDVRPRSATRPRDVRVVENAQVDFTDGRLSISVRPRLPYNWLSDGGAVDIVIELPTGSSLDVKSAMGDIICRGEFLTAELKSAMGQIRVEHSGDLRAKTGYGDLTVERVVGQADIHTGSGRLRIGEIDGDAVVRNGNGDTVVGDVTGDLRARAANGDINIARAGKSVVAKSSNGSIQVGEVERGAVTLETSMGSLTVGVREGSAAWLDLNTKYGHVKNELDATGAPGESSPTTEIRARSAYGDITIRRSPGVALPA